MGAVSSLGRTDWRTEVPSIVGKTMGRMKLLRDEKMNKYKKNNIKNNTTNLKYSK